MAADARGTTASRLTTAETRFAPHNGTPGVRYDFEGFCAISGVEGGLNTDRRSNRFNRNHGSAGAHQPRRYRGVLNSSSERPVLPHSFSLGAVIAGMIG
jgi:hypothetical protein